MLSARIGFIGAGRMATALARGFVKAGLVRAESLAASDPSAEARTAFQRELADAKVESDNAQIVSTADVVLLAVKPQQMDDVLADIRAALRPESLVVSIAAGVTLGQVAAGLPDGQRIVRVMPNTPCLIGRGASGYSLGPHATVQDGRLVAELLAAVGVAYEVPEKQLDAVTGLSGSGPAFVYTMIEALSDGGVEMGLPRELAAELAVRTVAGAAEMVVSTGETPAALRDRVTSPGGTTLAGLKALEAGGFQTTVIEAVRAATRRSEELGRPAT
jgi:pyrroline-5-carboxylate reductase